MYGPKFLTNVGKVKIYISVSGPDQFCFVGCITFHYLVFLHTCEIGPFPMMLYAVRLLCGTEFWVFFFLVNTCCVCADVVAYLAFFNVFFFVCLLVGFVFFRARHRTLAWLFLCKVTVFLYTFLCRLFFCFGFFFLILVSIWFRSRNHVV